MSAGDQFVALATELALFVIVGSVVVAVLMFLLKSR